MFYWLCPWLRELWFGFNVLRYITFRAAFAAITAFLLSVALGPPLIRKLRSLKVEERVRKEDSRELDLLHKKKEGTPTMGGILILLAVILSILLWANLQNHFIHLVLLVTIWLGVVGFLDGWMKLRGKSKGLRGKYKLLGQILLGLLIGWYLYHFRSAIALLWGPGVEVVNSDYSPYLNKDYATVLTIPFFKNLFLPLSFFYIPFVALVIVGASNAVNLTDGLDGLATGNIIFVALIYGILAYVVGNWRIASYLQVLFVEGSGELTIFCTALVGACLGFLWFNSYPAQVFMGDTGSLALGGALGAVAVIAKHELLLIIVGGIFVAEALSVIIQVLSFKLRGKRVFAIAPLHHHFELRGWEEPKVIVRFWIIATILAFLALSTLKLR